MIPMNRIIHRPLDTCRLQTKESKWWTNHYISSVNNILQSPFTEYDTSGTLIVQRNCLNVSRQYGTDTVLLITSVRSYRYVRYPGNVAARAERRVESIRNIACNILFWWHVKIIIYDNMNMNKIMITDKPYSQQNIFITSITKIIILNLRWESLAEYFNKDVQKTKRIHWKKRWTENTKFFTTSKTIVGIKRKKSVLILLFFYN